ncbi:serine hydrolase domain-containing protein [Sinosporangium siamense]|uniref:Hydrolase n=1 Tax=Sinosporangium siamense TaxID=1367973 RepID=A0A919RIX1_9ACTN|nr:serine hydrolase domain-containing protein [Sinosporangium siamense]GII92709.1 hydrolase [Sinosporangium siamense]
MAVALFTLTPATAALAEPVPSEGASAAVSGIDRRELRRTLDGLVEAGMPGVYAGARDGHDRWSGAAGVADLETGRPVRPWMRHRVASLTKTFVAVAVLQQVKQGTIELDAPISRYVADLVPGERGDKITVRMLLNHTSGIRDYILWAFPSFLEGSAQSVEDNRFRTFRPEELVALGLAAPPTGQPGEISLYSNTNYILAGILLKRVTGLDPEAYITRHVIRPAGLKDTYFPRTPYIAGPHSKAYDDFHGLLTPVRDFSVYNMSWLGTAGSMISTVDDLNRFFRLLFTGMVLGPAEMREMLTTVPGYDQGGNPLGDYGLGIYAQNTPCGRFWAHSGVTFGMGTLVYSTPDGERQFSVGFNQQRWHRLDGNGVPQPHPIDRALGQVVLTGLCGGKQTAAKAADAWKPTFVTDFQIKR